MSHLRTRLTTALFLTLTGPLLQAAVVTTADNTSPAGDGQTSLLEALSSLQDSETITFNIPGAGPHYIVTPEDGYPLITRTGVTIDGYSQPGSSPNTAAPDQPRDTRLRIVLDSRTAEPGQRRLVIDFPGFGTSESCILGLMDAPNATIRGLSFLNVAGSDNDFDAYVYCIALIGGSTGARVQGCWFGLDPARNSWSPGPDGAVAGVAGARSAVASFKWQGISSSGLVFGTDGDGTGDAGEGNVCMAQRLAVHLETPDALVAGNWFNLYPDGSFLSLEEQALELEDGTLEAIENGDGTDMRIGTNGDGTSDVIEGNRFGPVNYTEFAEFWRPALGIVFAGNHVGMDLDGLPSLPNPGQSLLAVRQDSSMRIGSDGNGLADAAEGNHISGLGGSFVRLRGFTRISARGNEFSGNSGRIPVGEFESATTDLLFSDILQDSFNAVIVLDPASTPSLISGSFPVPLNGIPAPVLDLYLADAYGLYADSPQGRSWLGMFQPDGPGDLDPAAGRFQFDVTSLALTASEVGHLTATASYVAPEGAVATTNFSETLAPATLPPPLGGLTILEDPAGFILSWTGGTPPYRVFKATSPAGSWASLSTVPGLSATIPFDAAATPREFYRIRDGAAPR